MGNIVSSVSKLFAPPSVVRRVETLEKKVNHIASEAWWFVSNTAWVAVIGGLIALVPIMFEYEKEIAQIEEHKAQMLAAQNSHLSQMGHGH